MTWQSGNLCVVRQYKKKIREEWSQRGIRILQDRLAVGFVRNDVLQEPQSIENQEKIAPMIGWKQILRDGIAH